MGHDKQTREDREDSVMRALLKTVEAHHDLTILPRSRRNLTYEDATAKVDDYRI